MAAAGVEVGQRVGCLVLSVEVPSVQNLADLAGVASRVADVDAATKFLMEMVPGVAAACVKNGFGGCSRLAEAIA